MKRKICSFILAAATFLVLAVPVNATIMLQLNLEEITERAGTIFRGTVISIQQGTVEAGGGELPTVTYRIAVEELFKGTPTEVKGENAVMEITMVGGLKPNARSVDGKQHFSPFREVPRLDKGGDYLLFASPESAIGLSTTIGLGQGAFKVAPVDGELHAVNEFNNAGLGLNGPGPVKYVDLSARINELLGQ